MRTFPRERPHPGQVSRPAARTSSPTPGDRRNTAGRRRRRRGSAPSSKNSGSFAGKAESPKGCERSRLQFLSVSMNVGAKPSVLVPRSVVAFTPMLQPSADAVRVTAGCSAGLAGCHPGVPGLRKRLVSSRSTTGRTDRCPRAARCQPTRGHAWRGRGDALSACHPR
jgi:hypothetical protein